MRRLLKRIFRFEEVDPEDDLLSESAQEQQKALRRRRIKKARTYAILALLYFAFDWQALASVFLSHASNVARHTFASAKNHAAGTLETMFEVSPVIKKAAGAAFWEGDVELVLRWQPAYCEDHPDVPECDIGVGAMTYGASHFVLKTFKPLRSPLCMTSRRNKKNYVYKNEADILGNLRPLTLASLKEILPGAYKGRSAELWRKEGKCYPGKDMDAYFSAALKFTREVNRSAVRELFISRLQHSVTWPEIRQAFEQTFGARTARNLSISCLQDPSDSRILMHELSIRFNTKHMQDGNSNLASLLSSGAGYQPYPSPKSCAVGIVDMAGFQ